MIEILKDNSEEQIERSILKKLLSLELCKEILGNPLLSEEEKEEIKNLIVKIDANKYYYIYEQQSNPNSGIIKIFQETENVLEKPIVLTIPKEINYDIEMYKIGKTCNGLKKRYAIIKRGKFYSSKKPLTKINIKELKDKTVCLNGAQIIIEAWDTVRKGQGEWSTKNKKYRIKIIYLIPNISSFFIYFDNEKKMEEVLLILFEISLNENTKKKN